MEEVVDIPFTSTSLLVKGYNSAASNRLRYRAHGAAAFERNQDGSPDGTDEFPTPILVDGGATCRPRGVVPGAGSRNGKVTPITNENKRKFALAGIGGFCHALRCWHGGVVKAKKFSELCGVGADGRDKAFAPRNVEMLGWSSLGAGLVQGVFYCSLRNAMFYKHGILT